MSELLSRIQKFNQSMTVVSEQGYGQSIVELREEWVIIVCLLIENSQFDLAEQLFYQVLLDAQGNVNMQWLDTRSAALHSMFRGYEREKAEGTDYTFQYINTPGQMVTVCQELKLLLWRIEFGLNEELQKEIVGVIRSCHIGAGFLIEMIDQHTVQEDKVYVANKVATLMETKEELQYSLPLLMYAYDLDSMQQDTIFHLVYVLYELGEISMATELSGLLTENSVRVRELLRRLEQKIPFETIQMWRADQALLSVAGEEIRIMTNLSPAVYRRSLPEISIPKQEQTITCIICVNDERKYEECKLYLDRLYVPSGYRLKVLPIRGAYSMTDGYQRGMDNSEPGYKIYMHQDLLLVDSYVLYNIIHVHEADSGIGIVGIAGTPKIPESLVWWESDDKYYCVYQDNVTNFSAFGFRDAPSDYDHEAYNEVRMLDGILLATKVDLPWRTDIFDGWHFYDMSQSLEFEKNGYKAAVLRVKKPCAIHFGKCEPMLDDTYEAYRGRCKEEYSDHI